MFEELTSKLTGAKVFSKLDAASGFWQISLEEESRKLTTIIRYSFWAFLLQSLVPCHQLGSRTISTQNVRAPKQREECHCLHGWCTSYDLGIRKKNMIKFYRKIKEAGMKLNEKKCVFGASQIKFLGYMISSEGIAVEPEKVQAITQMEQQKDVTELKRFLGMVNYLHRHLPRMSAIAKPLTDPLKKDSAWTWTCEQETHSDKLKQCWQVLQH